MGFIGFAQTSRMMFPKLSRIINVNNKRWEIEECLIIMKSEFKSRPVYLSNYDRIEAHFITCFISLIIYRLLERNLMRNLHALKL